MPKLIITGCGRSGTKYISTVLTAVGVKCYHEVFFGAHLARNDVYRTDVEDVPAEASWLAAGAEKYIALGTVVAHQTRNPVCVIRSMMGIKSFVRQTSYLKYLYRCLAEHNLEDLNEINACMEFWIRWNAMAENITGFRYRIEDFSVVRLIDLCRAAGKSMTPADANAVLRKAHKKVNSRNRDHSVSWESLPSGDRKSRLLEAAEYYGYPLEELESA